VATRGQRQEALAQQGIEETRIAPNGRRTLRRFTTPLGQKPSKLAKIKTVGEAWQEWEFGIGGNKPAKDFKTRPERSSTYSRRLPLYHTLRDLVLAQRSPSTAIRLVNDCYRDRKWSFLRICDDLRIRRNTGDLQDVLRV